MPQNSKKQPAKNEKKPSKLKRLINSRRNGDKEADKVPAPDYEAIIANLRRENAKVINALGQVMQPRNEQRSILEESMEGDEEAKRTLLELVVDTPRHIKPSLSVINPRMRYLLSMFHVVNWLHIPEKDWPKDATTNRTLSIREIWLESFYDLGRSLDGKHLVRLTGIAENQNTGDDYENDATS